MTVDLPERDIAGELHLRPGERPPVVLVNNQPLGPGRLNWLFVPRLRADGWFRTGGREHRFAGDVAYHDHNWGRFRWGDDFGWELGRPSCPPIPEGPWSFVLMQMTDRRRLRTLAQALYVWRHDEPVALFRDGTVRMRSTGRLARAADCTLPPAMALVLGGDAADVPQRVTVTAEQAGDRVQAEFEVESYARVAHPSEVSLDQTVVLVESSGLGPCHRLASAATPSTSADRVSLEVLHG